MKQKYINLKTSKLGFVSLFSLLLFSVILLVYSCNKEEKQNDECVECKANERQQIKKVVVNGQNYSAMSVPTEGYPLVTSITENEIQNVDQTIKSILVDYNIPLENSKTYALIRYYDQPIVESTPPQTPTAVLIYYINQLDNRHYAGYWKKNGTIFSFQPNLSGITSYTSLTDILRLDQISNLHTKEVFAIMDNSVEQGTAYRTVFQIKLERALDLNPEGTAQASGGGGGGPTDNCFFCGGFEKGMCASNTFGGGLNPVGAWTCIWSLQDIQDICNGNNCRIQLANAGYNMNQADIDYLYWLRDSVLMGTEAGQKLIDDYYYSSFVMDGKIPFTFAWKVWKLYGINLFTKFPQYFTSTSYDATVIVDLQVKDILSDIFTEAKGISNDVRFQQIIRDREIEMNAYYNQPFSVIRNIYD